MSENIQVRTHVDFAVADMLVRLNFHSDSLRKEFERHFPHTPQTIRPAAVVEVRHNVISAAHPSSGLLPLCGEDEYEGIFDESTDVARVHLTGPHPINALANFLRRVCMRLITANKGLVFHGACVVRDGRAYLFCGPSRVGKSTICRLSVGCEIVSDDLTAVRKQNGHFLAWGLPAPNTYQLTPNTFPKIVRAAFRLVQDNIAAVSPIAPSAATAAFLALQHDDLSSDSIAEALQILDDFTNTVPCYELRFAEDPSFWEYIDKEVDRSVET